ncbi:MAG: DnaD domain-containing protein [Tuberibacillus sp.]
MEKQWIVELITKGQAVIPRLLIENYSQIGLNEAECMLIIHLYTSINEGNPFPTPDELAAKMSCNTLQCAEQLRHLIQRGFLDIVQDMDGQVYTEKYSLNGLWEKLASYFILSQKNEAQMEQEDALYTIFEKEFGRPLSPIECETLAMWMDQDHHTAEMIKAALREAVISGKLNFRYIDRILFDWKKNGIKTLEQAKAHGEKIRRHYQTNREPNRNAADKKPMQFPLYNWLEN